MQVGQVYKKETLTGICVVHSCTNNKPEPHSSKECSLSAHLTVSLSGMI